MPTFTTSNARLCLLLPDGRYGLLRMEDAERLQVKGGEGCHRVWMHMHCAAALVVIVFKIGLSRCSSLSSRHEHPAVLYCLVTNSLCIPYRMLCARACRRDTLPPAGRCWAQV